MLRDLLGLQPIDRRIRLESGPGEPEIRTCQNLPELPACLFALDGSAEDIPCAPGLLILDCRLRVEMERQNLTVKFAAEKGGHPDITRVINARLIQCTGNPWLPDGGDFFSPHGIVNHDFLRKHAIWVGNGL